MAKVLIVGSGLTGSLTAYLLHKTVPKIAQIYIWDKSRGTGGRMSTARSSHHPKCTVDIGAQYISVSPMYQVEHKQIYDELLNADTIQPLIGVIEGDKHSSDTKHYVAKDGLSAICKHFIGQSNAIINFDHMVHEMADVKHHELWKVKTTNNVTDTFDAVVLTMPVPQMIDIEGYMQQLVDTKPDIKQKLSEVHYSSRFALGLFYEPGTEINMPWCSKYIRHNDCIVFVSLDNKKRNLENPEGGPSVVVHTSTSFARKHLEDDRSGIEENILENVKAVLPSLPEPSSVKFLKWRFSQVTHPVEDRPGCLVVDDNPLLVLGGDGFTQSTVDGCIESALKIVENFKVKFNQENKKQYAL